MTDFLSKAKAFWTPEREKKVTGGKSVIVRPSEAPQLLRVLGLLNRDGSMSADAVRKYSQINHMLALVEPQLRDLAARHAVVRVLDACCGTSFLALLVAWLLKEKWGKKCEVIGIDSNEKVIATSTQRASELGYGDFVKFAAARMEPGVWGAVYSAQFPSGVGEPREAGEAGEAPSGSTVPRPHLLIALHACDTATDHAAATGIALKADVMALAPCCHAELARAWKEIPAAEAQKHPFGVVFQSPNLRRETAAQITDAMRMLLVRARGYEVTATEFVPAAHTPKNRLLVCVRRGSYLREAGEQYQSLKVALAGCSIYLEGLLRDTSATQ